MVFRYRGAVYPQIKRITAGDYRIIDIKIGCLPLFGLLSG